MRFADIRARVNQYIWSYDACDPGQPRVPVRHYLQIITMVGRDLLDGMISLRSMGLVYTTLLSIVPLLAISLTLLKGFGLHDQLEPTLVSLFDPLGESSVELASRIVLFVDKVKIGVLGALGSALLMFTVLSLIHKVESALNQSWRLQHSGKLIQRMMKYLGVLLVVPLLMLSAVVITASSSSNLFLELMTRISFLDPVIEIGGKFTPYVLIVGAFSFIYVVVPNTRVTLRSAFFGALIAGLLWKFAALVFGWFIDYSTNYKNIYSGFAIFLMLIIWIYLGWLIVLTGSSFAYYHQYPQRLKWRRGDFHLSARMREQLVFQLMVNITRYHDRQSSMPTTVDNLARYQRVPVEVMRRLLDCLEADALIVSSKNRPHCYFPARSSDSIRLVDIIRSARHAEDNRQRGSLYCESAVATVLNEIEREYEARLGERTLADFINSYAE